MSEVAVEGHLAQNRSWELHPGHSAPEEGLQVAGGRGRRQRPSCSLPSPWAGRVCGPREFGGGHPHPVVGALGRQLGSLDGQDGLPWRMARPSG